MGGKRAARNIEGAKGQGGEEPPAAGKGRGRRRAPPGELPDAVVVHRTSEIDPKNPLASGTSAPVRKIWLEAARQAREERRVVIELIGEGRGLIAVPVVFGDEKEAMEIMTPAIDALVVHCAAASPSKERPVMVDFQELRERLKLEPEQDWASEHGWFHKALASRDLLCMYVFSPGYLLEFAVAIARKQGFELKIAKQDPGFYELAPQAAGDGVIIWNWARAMGDVIAGGHAWSYFGMLLALAPTVAKKQEQEKAKGAAAGPANGPAAGPANGPAAGPAKDAGKAAPAEEE